jgi:thymidylate synthase
MNIEEQYLNLLKEVRECGVLKDNRTGISAYKLPRHTMIQHDMSHGFPLLTTKKMGIKSISAELEFFIKGLCDKQWLKDRKCHIWNEWCNPSKIPTNLSDDDRKEFQLKENDLGYVYGYQWRNFNSQDYDQLSNVIQTLKNKPNDRRMIVSAWNPLQFDMMALPPCHVMWGVDVIDNKLNLWWTQRSVDIFLGLPYNIASYAILLKLLCKESSFEEGILTGFLVDVHLYENHIEQADLQLSRKKYDLPKLEINNYTSIFNWKYTDLKLLNYKSHDSIKAPIAI